jgi:hypothetical protein
VIVSLSEAPVQDIVEILAHGLLWLDVLRDYHGSIRSHNFRRFVTEGGLIAIVLHALPSQVGVKVLQVSSHMFFIKDGNNAIVLVSPNDRRIADVIR